MVRLIKIITALVFVLIGALFAFGIPGLLNSLNSECTFETTGIVVDHFASDDGDTYAPVYKFEMDGKSYEARSPVYTSLPPSIGKENTIMVEPSDPTHISVPSEEKLMTKIFSIIGFVFLGLGVFILLFPIGLLVKGKY